MTDKKNQTDEGSVSKGNRRDFLKKVGTAGALGAATAVGGSLVAGAATAEAEAVTFNFAKMDLLAKDPAGCAEYVAAVDEVVNQMLKDAQFANTILENTEGVRLIDVFNQNRKNIEPYIGKVDGRTKAGRYKKMLHAAELFHNTSGVDGVELGADSEELLVYKEAAGDVVISSTCSGCSPSDPAVLGCCIIHFWTWSEGGSCSPCNG